MLEECENDFERADYLRTLLVARATHQEYSDADYRRLRAYFVKSPYAHLLPKWVRTCRSLEDFWGFIQPKFEKYRWRRSFISEELEPLLQATEAGCVSPVEQSIGELLENPSYESVSLCWQKCLDRSGNDPDGALTAAKSLLETVLRHGIRPDFRGKRKMA